MDPHDYVRIIRRHWRLIVSVTLCAALLGATLALLTPREYEARSQLFIATAGSSDVTELVQGGNFTQRQVTTYADIVTAPTVLEPVIADLDLDESASSLASRVSARVARNTVLIDISVVDDDPARAAQIANAVAERFTDVLMELEQVEATGQSPVRATVIRPASQPTSPANAGLPSYLVVGTILGAVIAMGLALLRDILDSRVRRQSDVERVTDKPAIGAIPFDKVASNRPLLQEIDPFSPRAEAFRTLRTNLVYVDPDHQPHTLLVTSTVPGEGKTTTTANLAYALAASGSTVCLIEGDLRRPRLLDYLGLENAAGLTDVLVGRAGVDDLLHHYREGLVVLGCGPIPPNPSEILGSEAMRNLIKGLESRFDYLLIDAPPLLPVTDAAILATITHGTLVVVGAGIVKREQLGHALQSLENVDANVLGLVLNRIRGGRSDAYAYYRDGYAPQAAGNPKATRTTFRGIRARPRS